MADKKFRVNVYIDGFNFYYGLKNNNWKKYYWLDIVKFYELFMKENQSLNKVIYCTAKISRSDQRKRQKALFDVNDLNPKFELIYGKFLEKEVGYGPNRFKTFEEKQTDVNLAINLIRNIINDTCDTSIIVSADSDIIPAIELAKEIKPDHKIYCHFPPKRHSVDLQNKCDGVINLERYETRFKKCILDEEVKINEAISIKKPTSWC